MGKLLILSITDGEEQLLDKLKDFLAEAPGIEIVEPPATKHTLTFPGLELHLRKQTVKWRGQPLHLTHLEFFTLAYLARHPGWIFTQEQIYEAVWHEFPEHCGAAVANIISQLRRKMGPATPSARYPTAAISSSCLHNLRSLFRKKRSYPLWVTAFFYLSQDHNSPPLSQKSVQTEHNRLYGADRTISFR